MNLTIALIMAWTFSFLEDIWFNRLLTYQLSGEAEKLNKPESDSVSFFRTQTRNKSWVVLAFGLTLIVMSFPKQFTYSVSGLFFASGVFICLVYIFTKLRTYFEASRILKEDEHK